jgi:hypothetical protein
MTGRKRVKTKKRGKAGTSNLNHHIQNLDIRF